MFIESAREIATQRIRSIRERDAVPDGQVQIVIGSPFDIALLSKLMTEAYAYLTLSQRAGLTKVLLYMKQADDVNEQMRVLWMRSRERQQADAQGVETLFADQLSVLEQVEALSSAYLNGTLNEQGLPG
jgi:hypothetical protein